MLTFQCTQTTDGKFLLPLVKRCFVDTVLPDRRSDTIQFCLPAENCQFLFCVPNSFVHRLQGFEVISSLVDFLVQFFRGLRRTYVLRVTYGGLVLFTQKAWKFHAFCVLSVLSLMPQFSSAFHRGMHCHMFNEFFGRLNREALGDT